MKIILALILSLIAGSTLSQPGSLITNFGTGGKVQTDFGGVEPAYAMTTKSDGKIVVGGYYMISGNQDFAIAQYNINGSLDATFSGDGKVTTPIGTAADVVYGLAVQSDGKIVAAGYSFNSSKTNFALVRYNGDGTLDNTFSSDGKLITAVGSGYSQANAVAIQNDGKIVAAGYSSSGLTVVRYMTDGTLDASFSGDGIATTSLTSFGMAYSVAIQNDGKIIIGGADNGGTGNVAIVRFNSDGTLDTGFDGDGKVATRLDANSSPQINAIVLQSDGKIVAAGKREVQNMSDPPEASTDFVVLRYNSDGSLDAGFDGDGIKIIDLALYEDEAKGVAIQSDGKIVVAGSSNFDFALIRLNSDGSFDNSFDTDGKVVTNINVNDWGQALALYGNRIYMAGFSSSNNFSLAAYQNDGTPLPLSLTSFSALKETSSILLQWQTASEENTSYFDVEKSSDGRTFLFIGQVRASGTSNDQRFYSFLDHTLLEGFHYYRLKMVDLDGKSAYSSIVVTNVAAEKKQAHLFPNPSGDVFQLQTSLKGSLSIIIYDIKGHQVKAFTARGNDTLATFPIAVTGLNSGIYAIKVCNKDEIQNVLFIKQ